MHSSVAYAVTGLFLAIAAVYYTLDNVRGHNADLSSLYSTLTILLLFIVPILTSRIIAEERRSGVLTLLITSPAKIAGIVMGKFFAVFVLIAIMTAFTLIFPLLLLLFTPLYPLSLLGSYIGLLLFGAAITAFGIFASALTESQVIAAIISFVTLLILLIARPIGAALGGTAAKALASISPFARYAEFGRGVFSLSNILYFLGFTFGFLFLTACLIEAGCQGGNPIGNVYSVVSIVSVISIILLVNLIAGLFPLKADLSEGKRYTVGEVTKELLATLDKDITIYGLFDDGKADEDYIEIRELLENYKKYSGGKIHTTYADPDRDTVIISQLDPNGTAGLRKNDFYVTDGTNGIKVSYQDLFQMEYDRKTSVWFKTGSSAEKAISAAIRALTTANHGKMTIGDGFTFLTSENKPELPGFGENYSELLLEVSESEIIPLEFYGLYFPTAREFDVPDGGTVLAISPNGKALAAAWELNGNKYVLIASSDFLSDTVKTQNPANYVTNRYFADSALEWVNQSTSESSIDIINFRTGELQIPRYKADFIGFLTVIVFPFAIFLRGFVVWRKRRFL